MSKKYRSEGDVRAAIEKKTAKPVNPHVWEKMLNEGYIQELLDDYGTIKDVINRYREEEEFFQKGVRVGAETYGTRRMFPVKKGSSPASKADVVLSRVIAGEISKLPFVKQFRREVLNGNLLHPEEIETWIQAKRKEDGPPTKYVKIRPKGIDVTIDKNNWWPLKVMPSFETDDVIGVEHEFLSYPSKIDVFPINVDGTLGRLKSIAEEIIKYYSPAWDETQAVGFILTGQTPVIPKVSYSINITSSGGPCWVTLKFDARTTPQDLTKEYSRIRHRILGNSHVKPLTQKHQELAVFAAEHKDGLTWEKLMHKWNERFPKWAYTNYRLFCRDAVGATKRLLNSKVDYTSLLSEAAQKNNGQ